MQQAWSKNLFKPKPEGENMSDKRYDVSVHFNIMSPDGTPFHSTLMKWADVPMPHVVAIEALLAQAVQDIAKMGQTILAAGGTKAVLAAGGPFPMPGGSVSTGGVAAGSAVPTTIPNPSPGQPGHDPSKNPGATIPNPPLGQPGHRTT
jgi:hypothetical protein